MRERERERVRERERDRERESEKAQTCILATTFKTTTLLVKILHVRKYGHTHTLTLIAGALVTWAIYTKGQLLL